MGLPAGWEVEEDETPSLPEGWAVEEESLASETPASQSDAAPVQNAAATDKRSFWENLVAQAKKMQPELEERNSKTLGMNNDALLAGMVRIPALGFRQDLGQFGAAIMDKSMGSEIPFGDLVKRAKPQVEKYYSDLEQEHPVASGVGTMIGGLPMAMAVNPASAAAAKVAPNVAPWMAKALGIGAAGLDNAAMAGLLRFNETGDTDKALDDAKLAGAMGAGFAAAPVMYQGAKTALGKGAQLPRQGLDGLAKLLGTKADDVAVPIAQAADNVIPIRPDQADVETKMTPLRNLLRDQDGSMYVGGKSGPPNKDPEFLRKSKELADMLGQNADSVPPPAAAQAKSGEKSAESFAKKRLAKRGFEPTEDDIIEEMISKDADVFDSAEIHDRGDISKVARPSARSDESKVRQWDRLMDEPPPAASAADKATNAKGGSADMYDPMGVGAAEDVPNVRPPDEELFADVRRKAAAAGKPDLSAAREATAGEESLWGEALDRMRAKGLIENFETNQLGDHVFTSKFPEPFPDPITMTKAAPEPFPDPVTSSRFMPQGGAPPPPPAAPVVQPGPTVEAEAAQIASGKERIRKLLGIAGGISGGYAGGQAGGILGAFGGASIGSKAAVGSFNKFDKGADKLHTLGQKMLTDPAKLTQLEQQGGQMGKAAGFIMEGARQGGEAAMAARAYIISSQPWWRAQFANQDEN
jgi:hypothetical protein